MWGKFLHGRPRMLTRDLFVVANLLVLCTHYVGLPRHLKSELTLRYILYNAGIQCVTAHQGNGNWRSSMKMMKWIGRLNEMTSNTDEPASYSVYSASVARVWRYKNLIITIIITSRHGRVSYETEMLWSDEGRVPAHIALCLRNSDIAGKPRGRHINAYACSGVADHRKRLYRTCVTLPNFVILRLRL